MLHIQGITFNRMKCLRTCDPALRYLHEADRTVALVHRRSADCSDFLQPLPFHTRASMSKQYAHAAFPQVVIVACIDAGEDA